MRIYNVWIGGVLFGGTCEANSDKDLVSKIKDQIENLWPLNMSEDSVEAYRDRFRNKEVTFKLLYNK